MDSIKDSLQPVGLALVVMSASRALLKKQQSGALRSKRAEAAAARRLEGQATVEAMALAVKTFGKTADSGAAAGAASGANKADTAQQASGFDRSTLDPVNDVAARVASGGYGACEALLLDVLGRSVASTQSLNNITEFHKPLPDLLAEAKAVFADDEGSEARKGGGLLLKGLPVSVKECVGVAGRDSTIGTARRVGVLSKEDAVVVQVLKAQGALVYCRTNVPQTMLSYECCNPVFGQTSNPYHLKRGPGGSSGGEGSLLGSHGGILGIGSDVGGSLRIPAAFSGCCGFKPSVGRISSRGSTSSVPGAESVKSSLGPMAREVDGLVLVMRALLGSRKEVEEVSGGGCTTTKVVRSGACGLMHALDPNMPDMPFDESKYPFPLLSISSKSDDDDENGDEGAATTTRSQAAAVQAAAQAATSNGHPKARAKAIAKAPLRVGWFHTDGFAEATPCCVRAVQVAKEALLESGHELVEFELVKEVGTEAMTLFAQLIGADQAETLTSHNLADEDIDPILKTLVFLIGMPWLLRVVVVFVNRLLGYHRIAALVGGGGKKTVNQLWALHAKRNKLSERFMGAWAEQNLDGLICPASVFPSPPIGAAAELSAMCCYTALFNLLNCPAGVLPVGLATQADEDELLASYPTSDPWDKKVVAAARGAVGCPIAVQVVARPWDDETCLRIMKEVELAVVGPDVTEGQKIKGLDGGSVGSVLGS